MGIPGSGKSRLAADLDGYERLNRDERGGSLAASPPSSTVGWMRAPRGLVLDNTYLTRASRNLVVEVAARHGAALRCVWLDTPLAQAQVNLVLRQLDLFGRLPEPAELRVLAKGHPGLMAPTSQLRAVRELEPPTDDEGFVAVERVPFRRDPGSGVPGVFVAADAVPGFRVEDPSVPHLVFGWQVPGDVVLPGAVVAQLSAPGRPAGCWCRPPLPGLVLAFCHDTAWTRRARCSWERPPATARWPPRWARGTSAASGGGRRPDHERRASGRTIASEVLSGMCPFAGSPVVKDRSIAEPRTGASCSTPC